MKFDIYRSRRVLALAAAVAAGFSQAALAAWEPTKTVEFIIPAGTGGGADQMARFIQGIVAKHKLMKQPMVVINKAGGAGAEGFLDVKESKGDPHKLIITLSNLFTTPLATHTPFNWRDLTPVQMMALDNFVLWVNAETPYKTPKEYVAAVAAGAGKFKMGGTGSKQEDQIITVAIERQTGAGGGPARRQARRLERQQPDRGGGAMAGRHLAAAVRVRFQAHALQGQDHQDDVVV
jgi:tripartite-type tricarboxylate transporter receptor subunit TctC